MIIIRKETDLSLQENNHQLSFVKGEFFVF